MENKRAPYFRVVKFLKDLIDDWDPSEESSEEFREQIRDAIVERKIAVTTASVYLTAVKRACMTTKKAVDPQFLPDLEAVCEAQDIKALERKQLLAELKQFSDLPTYDQYKLWTAARLTVNPSLFQTCLKDLSFFLDPLWADWSVNSAISTSTLSRTRG